MRLLKKNKSGISLLDLATSLTIICFLIWIFGGIIGILSKTSRETTLRYQLSNLRMMLMLYKELNGQYPLDLEALLKADYRVSKSDRPVLSENFSVSLKQDAKGGLLDAFGNRLYYDPRKGVILSQTKGYNNW